MVSLIGCKIVLSDNEVQPDLFQIIDEQRGIQVYLFILTHFTFFYFKGNIYKFRAGSQIAAERWCKHLRQAASGEETPLPSNLMSFE